MSGQDMGWDEQQFSGSVNMSVDRTAGEKRAGAFSPCTSGTTVAFWLDSPSKAK